MQALLCFINNIDSETIYVRVRRQLLYNAVPFVVFFLLFVVATLCADGYQLDPISGEISVRAYKYFYNLIEMPWVLCLFLLGVAGVLYAIVRSAFFKRWIYGIWFSGIGTIFVVLSVFFLPAITIRPIILRHCGYAEIHLRYTTALLSLFTLEVMSVVSLVLPIVAGYIFFAWRAMDRKAITADEMKNDDHIY